MPLEAGEWLYADTGARVLPLPHALNDAVFRRSKPDAARTVDIGGRSARYPVFVGDDERNRVHDCFAAIGPKIGLTVDIDTEDRLDRSGWAAFLDNCRGTIGTEAGTWYLERDDRTALAIRAYIDGKTGPAIRADGAVHALGRRLPYRVKTSLRALAKVLPIRHEAIDCGAVDFAEIDERFFAGRPRCPVYSKCISSRHFDAAGAGACQILIRGRYNDILTPDEHYIPVDPDLGNADEAIARFRDPAERRRIAEAAYTLAHDRHTYRHRIVSLIRRAHCRPDNRRGLMCGLAGFLLSRPGIATAELEARLWRMTRTDAASRDPTTRGFGPTARAGLAHARLSIIDLSPAAHQPMASADGEAWISYNGEIYNFDEIRRELAGLGYPFRSRSDTEAIVNGWHAWGPGVFPRLRGMFALAIWDRRTRRLVLARDRIGKKPLYYAADRRRLVVRLRDQGAACLAGRRKAPRPHGDRSLSEPRLRSGAAHRLRRRREAPPPPII